VSRVAAERQEVEFTVGPGGRVVLEPRFFDQPMDVQLDPGVDLNRVYVGAEEISPDERAFTLSLPDRHGVTLGSFTSTGLPQAFLVNGGQGGRINRAINPVFDEWLRATPTGAFDRAPQNALPRKKKCRGRYAASADLDGDGDTDLLSSCEASTPKVWLREGDGWKDDSRKLRRLDAKGTAHRLVQLRGDLRPELVAAGNGRLRVFKREGRGWALHQRVQLRNTSGQIGSIAPADWNRDGQNDLFVASNSGNTLLSNRRGRLRPADPSRRGLPAKDSLHASWVDAGNDGRLDLHLLPQGLFAQRANGSFKRTGQVRAPRGARWGLASWPDLSSGGGAREAIVALKTSDGPEVRTFSRKPKAPRGRWLEVDLRGHSRNLFAVGARVRAQVAGRTLVDWAGNADSSRFSSGHYRVYFGLGRHKRVRRLTVNWPAGGRTVLRGVPANRLVTVEQGG
jgi:hypothetical protein